MIGGSASPPTAVFEKLNKSYGDHHVLRDVSFEVGPGRVTGLLGPNGAGKSTALRCLLGLVRPDSGTVTVHGSVGVTMDSLGFHPNVTVRRQLDIVARSLGLSAERTDEVLRTVGLEGATGKRVRSCSTGMRQRLALATALLPDPELLVLDEPLNGLDPEGIHWMRDLVGALAAEGRTVLLASHMLSEVARSVDDVVVLRGQVLFCGSLRELGDGDPERLESAYLGLASAQRS
ncbi:ABC transporter ATP-binding protein [Streptomyces azureus]|uniref:ABC transporter ATP-binding protein n=1 Tax=Streptomyces azureus TaxID=146537 RepID=UPI000AE54E79|nr:ATP-binding cassette domain-containing protein [Streptomyces azureus]